LEGDPPFDKASTTIYTKVSVVEELSLTIISQIIKDLTTRGCPGKDSLLYFDPVQPGYPVRNIIIAVA
jgi:hypothetical protein